MSRTNGNEILRIDHAHKYYNRGRNNELHVMNDINLSLPSAGLVAIFGKSGCGKTTLLNAIGGLDSIADGSIELFGENITQNPDMLRNKYIGYIFQNYNLNVNQTVFDNVADALRLCGMTDAEEIRTRVLASLKNVEMDKYKNRTPDTLSGGQQQRVAIARALVKNPAILLADEPTGNLDENNTVLVMDILKEISKTHLVLLVTHEANLVDYYCDRVIEIVDGRIVGDRENAEANGYVQRNKNDIYLGELEKQEASVSGVTLTRYGDATAPISLRLVTANGKTYLVCDTPGVKILDETSEVKLKEGVFHEVGRTGEEAAKNGHDLDMSALTPIEGKHYGRLFHFGNALKTAWIENFAKKQKKGKKLLRATLILLSVVMVFMTAVSAVSIKSLSDVYQNHDPHMFFLPLTEDGEYAPIYEHIGENGMDYACSTGMYPMNAALEFIFNTAAFMTAQAATVKADAYLTDVRIGKDLPLLAGSAELSSPTDVIITSAMADQLLESSTVSYIDSYEDLVGLVSSNLINRQHIRIVGVVSSDEKLMLADGLFTAQQALDNSFGLSYSVGLRPHSNQSMWKEPIGKGEMVVLSDGFKEGETVKLLGKEFKVTKTSSADSGKYYKLTLYPEYVKNEHGQTCMSLEDYIETSGATGKTEYQLTNEWLYEVFPVYLQEYCKLLCDSFSPWSGTEEPAFDIWWYAMSGDVYSYLSLMSAYFGLPISEDDAYAAYIAHQETGTWQDKEAVSAKTDFWTDHKLHADNYYDAYDRYLKSVYNEDEEYVRFVISDEDYIALSGCAGKSDPRFGVYAFNVFEYGWSDEIEYQNYMLIHTSDPDATRAYLTEHYGDTLITPDTVFAQKLADYRGDIIASSVTVAVILVLMCLCVFFIMRSSFMSRVREVGIYRAIGVSKKNLIFRFGVEALLLTTMTIFIGFLLSSLVIVYLSGAAFFSEILYFPVWLAAILLIVIYAASVFFGVLPVMALLSRTPSEILAKYDI